jgi:hypothetical protein
MLVFLSFAMLVLGPRLAMPSSSSGRWAPVSFIGLVWMMLPYLSSR